MTETLDQQRRRYSSLAKHLDGVPERFGLRFERDKEFIKRLYELQAMALDEAIAVEDERNDKR